MEHFRKSYISIIWVGVCDLRALPAIYSLSGGQTPVENLGLIFYNLENIQLEMVKF